MYQILEKVGLCKTSSGSYTVLRKRIKEENLEISGIKERAKKKMLSGTRLTNAGKIIQHEQLFTENCKHCRGIVKRTLIRDKLIEYKCEKCNNTGEWLGEKITLQLEHKNGVNNDNRIENLCFLCPNCHSQTTTFCGKNIFPKPIKKMCICGETITNISNKCNVCCGITKRKFEVDREELEKLIETLPLTKIGKKFNVTANTVKKRAKKLGIVLANRKGYWQKKNATKIE